jgi:hypothetical protein
VEVFMYDMTDPAALSADVGRLRERVRADRQTVSAPLVVFGALVLGHAVLAGTVGLAGAIASHLVGLLYWPVAGAAGLVTLWSHARRIAVRDGVGEGPRSYRPVTVGYVVSLPLIAIFFLPALFVGVFAPLVWPAAVLFAVGVRQHSRALKRVATGLAAAGAVQVLVIAVLSGYGAVAGWTVVGLELAAGLAMVLGAPRRAPAA